MRLKGWVKLPVERFPAWTLGTIRAIGVRGLIKILLGLRRPRRHRHALLHELLVCITKIVSAGRRLALGICLRIPLLRRHTASQDQQHHDDEQIRHASTYTPIRIVCQYAYAT